jgi:hypothetical protein
MDDLSRLLAQQPQPGARFGQGTLRVWNPDTFEHVIEWRGLRISGATILAGVDALTWQPGDELILLGADQSGRRGWTDWMVLGRAITPGPGAGTQAIDWMRSSLVRLLMDDLVEELLRSPSGQELAAWVLAQRIRAAQTDAEVEISSTSWVSAPGGPVVNNVQVSESGVALVTVSAFATADSAGTATQAALMSFEATGPTPVSPDLSRAAEITVIDPGGAVVIGGTPGREVVLTGLSPGTYSFSARYMMGPGPSPTWFRHRSLSVIAL